MGNTRDNAKTFIYLGSQAKYENEVLIQLHLLLGRLYVNKEEEDFEEILKHLKSNMESELINIDEFLFFSKDIANFCSYKIIVGDSSYYGKLFEFYSYIYLESEEEVEEEGKKVVKKKKAIMNGVYLGAIRMKNLIVLAASSGKIDLGRELLEEYVGLIEPKYRKIVEAYCGGYLFFKKAEYDKAEEEFIICVNEGKLFAWNAEANIFQIHYEKNNHWAFDNPIDNFMKRIKRNKNEETKNLVKCYLNFLKLLKEIFEIKSNPNSRKSISEIIKKN